MKSSSNHSGAENKRRPRKGRFAKVERFLLWTIVCLVCFHLIGGAFWLYHGYSAVFRTREVPENERRFTIEKGASQLAVLQEMRDRQLAPDPVFMRMALIQKKAEIVVKTGTYMLPERASAWDLLRLFHQGAVILHRITLPEGLDKWETAQLLGQSRWGDSDTFLKILEDPTLIANLDPDAVDLEGYLFPETYFFPEEAGPREIVATMVHQFKKATLPLLDQLPRYDFTVRQLVTLASLIEKETAAPQERATIAGVFHKRLKKGMLLQCDPTIIYGLKMDNLYQGVIYKSQIRRPHPYNTYVYAGLPPGPIASPGLPALKAAVEPEDNPFYYFVAKDDGTHHFSKSLREHNRAVRRYRR